MKKVLGLLFLSLMSFQLNPALVFEPYTQKLGGTSVSFDMSPIPAGTRISNRCIRYSLMLSGLGRMK
jgi:hypothetical protein